jgi:ATP-binding cassette subfamily F protein uup
MSEGEGRWTEYAGGYTDMVAQRGAGVAARKAKPPTMPKAAVATPAAPPAQGQRKLSFKEKHALETLPGLMQKLQAEAAVLEQRLADSNYFSRDAKGFDADIKRLAAIRDELTRAEEQWLELEMKREELEGA